MIIFPLGIHVSVAKYFDFVNVSFVYDFDLTIIALNCYFFNTLYTGGLFRCYMLDESICYLRVSGLFCRFCSIFDGKSCE